MYGVILILKPEQQYNLLYKFFMQLVIFFSCALPKDESEKGKKDEKRDSHL